MQQTIFGKNISERLYFTGLCGIAIALPCSNFLMSLSQFILAAAWLTGGDYSAKLSRFYKNKPALVFFLFYFIHLVGMAYTSDFQGALNDIRIKLPLLIFPFIVAGMPAISVKSFRTILWLFAGCVFIQTALVLINEEWMRISPIRLSMMVAFSVFILFHLGFSQPRQWVKIGAIAWAGWLVLFLILFPFDTGIVTFVCGLSCFVCIKVFEVRSFWLKVASVVTMMMIVTSTFLFIDEGVKGFFGDARPNHVEQITKNGEAYSFYPERKSLENGNYVWQYIAWNELENAWNQKSALAFNGKDSTGQQLSITLIRFLTSKNERKDAAGISGLTPEEIHAIENGVANVRYMDGMNLSDRLYETIWSVYEYKIGDNPQGSSVGQRFEFWKAGWAAFRQAPLFGNGTGSVLASLNSQYEKNHTVLEQSHRLKTHNQYLATGVALGIVGVSLLLLTFLFPVFFDKRWNDSLYMVFLIIILAAMFVEDTLETQPGVTFVAFFSALLLFSTERRTSDPLE